jgi:excisionase family DNA binding protein
VAPGQESRDPVDVAGGQAPGCEKQPGEGTVRGRELMSAEEVAEMLGMGQHWVYEQARRGRIPVIKLGRYMRFRRASIERWLDDIER